MSFRIVQQLTVAKGQLLPLPLHAPPLLTQNRAGSPTRWNWVHERINSHNFSKFASHYTHHTGRLGGVTCLVDKAHQHNWEILLTSNPAPRALTPFPLQWNCSHPPFLTVSGLRDRNRRKRGGRRRRDHDLLSYLTWLMTCQDERHASPAARSLPLILYDVHGLAYTADITALASRRAPSPWLLTPLPEPA
jgi:hypothetical protein